MIANRIIGYALDIESIRRSIKARVALIVLFVLTMGMCKALLSIGLRLSNLQSSGEVVTLFRRTTTERR